MKTFSTSGTGNQQTLSEIESNKMPVYENLEAVENDLSNLEEGQLGLTKDTGNELSQPVDAVESGNLHAVTSNAVAESLSYFTTEQKTGGKWIDGKPIYRKVIEGTITATDMDFNHNIANIDSLVTVTPFMCANSGDSINPSFYVSASYFFTGYATKTQLKIRTTSVYVNTQKYRIILEYTKTTD